MASCETKTFVVTELKEVRTAKQNYTLILSREEAEAVYAVASNVVGKSPSRTALDKVADALYGQEVRASAFPNIPVTFSG